MRLSSANRPFTVCFPFVAKVIIKWRLFSSEAKQWNNVMEPYEAKEGRSAMTYHHKDFVLTFFWRLCFGFFCCLGGVFVGDFLLLFWFGFLGGYVGFLFGVDCFWRVWFWFLPFSCFLFICLVGLVFFFVLFGFWFFGVFLSQQEFGFQAAAK